MLGRAGRRNILCVSEHHQDMRCVLCYLLVKTESSQALSLQKESNLTGGTVPTLKLYHDGLEAEATLAAWPQDSV